MNNSVTNQPSDQASEARESWFLTGATASGKTAIGIALAERLNAEIISLDSMTIYRGMNIGTATPTAAQRQRVPHHLLDILDPTEEFSLAQYVRRVGELIREIRGRGREVLFVGGTPLYLKSLLRGIFSGPPADWEFRRQVEAEIAEVGLDALRQRLEQIDPLSAEKLHPHDKRRMIRALEVYRQTGQPISHLQTQFDQGRPPEQCKVVVVYWPRAELYQRIDRRVDQMFGGGLVDEVRGLLAQYGSLGRTARQAVGYREVIELLRGDRDLAATIEVVKFRTHQFARRQETWFRSLRECRWFRLHEPLDADSVAAEIVALVQGGMGDCVTA